MKKDTELAKKENISIWEIQLVDEKTLKDYLLWSWTKLSDEQFKLFYWIAKSSNLNPFKREVYAIPYEKSFKNSNWVWEKKTDISIVSWYQVYIDRATATGNLDWWKVELTKTWAKITIYRKDFKYPFEWEVEKSEFQKTDKEGKVQWSWKTMPNFMIKKVAIWQGFRLAFPNEMWWLPYLQEEISNYQEGVIEEIKPKEIEKNNENNENNEDYEKLTKEKQEKNFNNYYDQFMLVNSILDVEKISKTLKNDIKNDSTFLTKIQLNELWSLINDIKFSLESKQNNESEEKKEEIKKEIDNNLNMFEFYKDIFNSSWHINELNIREKDLILNHKKYWFSTIELKELLNIKKIKNEELIELYKSKEIKIENAEETIIL